MNNILKKDRTVIKSNRALLVIICVFIFGVDNISHALDKQIAKKVRITASNDIKALATLTNEEFQAIALSSGRILFHVEAARQAIADGQKKAAMKNVDQGLKLVQIIEAAVPKHKVTTIIKSRDISYNHEEVITLRYVDIYDEQHIEDIITPLMQARKENGDSKNPKITDEPEIIESDEDLAINQHTSMKLDVVIARRMLEAAKKDLKEGKNDAADDDLLTLQDDGIIYVSYIAELPLVEAADNLKLAQIQLNSGLGGEALNTLKLASDDLKDYEKDAGESRAKEVRDLYKKIDKLTRSVKNENGLKKIMGKTKQEIGLWWSKTVNWMRN